MVEGSAHEARLWKPLPNGTVQCRLCSHFCIIKPGQRGICGVRENRPREGQGMLFTLVYGLPAAINVDPVEKKPLYHFLPGTRTFSLGTMGCNLSCSFCQNASLSQPPRLGQKITGHKAEPADLVAAALQSGSKSLSYTYSEPTIFFELVEDTARLARTKGLKNILVTNGFMSPECLDAFGPDSIETPGLIQAANVDLKAFTEDFYHERCGARLAPVLKNLKHMRALGWWIEVTTLLIPGLNEVPNELADLAAFIASELGPDTPWHLSRFHPDYKLLDRPVTPHEALLAARETGRSAGLRFVYIGNAQGQGFGDTLCPACGNLVLGREGFRSADGGLKNGSCAACGAAIPGVWT
jgi:pyruvate formate lyase activating enzyme